MIDPEFFVSPSRLNLAAVQALTAPTASYEKSPDPRAVLRKGLIEEVAEYAWEIAQGRETDKDQIEGEIGDVLWYISEISRYHNATILGLEAYQSLDDFQTQSKADDIIPIVDSDGANVDVQDQSHIALAVTALRVVDVLNPKNEDLWLPTRQRESLEKALGDLLTTSSLVALKYSVKLSDALHHTTVKLSNRERNPRVIDEVQQNTLMSSMRQRLNIHPFISKLLLGTLSAETSTEEN